MRWPLWGPGAQAKPAGRATRRHLLFEELETRQMLSAAALVAPAAVQGVAFPPVTSGTAAATSPAPASAPASTASSSTSAADRAVIGAAVVLTSSVLTPTAAAPLLANTISSSSSTLNPAGSTQLGVILAFGEDALTATDVPSASPDATMSTSAVPWAPSAGSVAPLGQALGGIVTRTESLEHGQLGNLNPLGRSSHGTVSSGAPDGRGNPGSPDANETPRPEDDSFNTFGSWRMKADAAIATDAAFHDLSGTAAASVISNARRS